MLALDISDRSIERAARRWQATPQEIKIAMRRAGTRVAGTYRRRIITEIQKVYTAKTTPLLKRINLVSGRRAVSGSNVGNTVPVAKIILGNRKLQLRAFDSKFGKRAGTVAKVRRNAPAKRYEGAFRSTGLDPKTFYGRPILSSGSRSSRLPITPLAVVSPAGMYEDEQVVRNGIDEGLLDAYDARLNRELRAIVNNFTRRNR